MYSPHAPYVGQTGCISGPGSLMDRFKEHISKAKTLKAFFTSTRYRPARNLMGFGKMPSLARLMAREGPASFSILGVEKVPRNVHGGILERSWFHRVGTNLNQVEPFGGLDRLYWDGLFSKRFPPPGALILYFIILLTISHIIWTLVRA